MTGEQWFKRNKAISISALFCILGVVVSVTLPILLRYVPHLLNNSHNCNVINTDVLLSTAADTHIHIMSRTDETTLASEVIAASLGGAISAGVLYPLEVLKTNMQGDPTLDKDESMVSYAYKLGNRQGWSVFVRGFETSALQSATEKALYFFAYTSLKHFHANVTQQDSLGTLTNLVLGCAAEWAHLPVSLPIDTWTTRIQTNTNPKQTPLTILLCMLQEPNKAQSWYKGLSAYTLLCLKPALQYTVYEQVKAWMLLNRKSSSTGSQNNSNNLSAGESFLLGMVARTIATVLVFPFLRAKVLLQTAGKKKKKETNETDDNNDNNTDADDDQPQTTSVVQVLQQIYQKDGISGWFQGLGPELTRGIFSAALMLMLKEQVAIRIRTALAAPPRNSSNGTANTKY